MIHRAIRTLLWLTVVSLLVFQLPGDGPVRDEILCQMLSMGLRNWHVAGRPLDDEFSRRAFDLYVKSLDFTKSFLLQEDIQRLASHRDRIDDELLEQRPLLAEEGRATLFARIRRVREVANGLLQTPFSLTTADTIELDADKREFCRSEGELKEFWQRRLKLMVLTRILELQKEKENAGAGQATLERKARAAVARNVRYMFDRLLKEDRMEALSRFFNAAARATDPHTAFFPPQEKEEFDIEMSGTLQGIGALLTEDNGTVKVVEIIPGGPAWLDGKLKAGDAIIAVTQEKGETIDIIGMRVTDAVKLIRGRKGTTVRLSVKKPDGRILPIPLVREVVVIQETYARSLLVPAPASPGAAPLGYIYLPRFYHDFHNPAGRNAAGDVQGELDRLSKAGARGVVLDLRGNGGGALDDAVALAGLFIEKGPIVQVLGKQGPGEALLDQDPAIAFAGPLVVLVDEASASASEIVAAALQDLGRALVIGSGPTFGKGTVQAVIDLDRYLAPEYEQYKPLGALSLTVQRFYRINGASTQGKGVTPDIVLPVATLADEIGERFLDYPLPADSRPATSYSRWPQLDGLKETLVHRSQERTARQPLFAAIASYARQMQQWRATTRESLELMEFRRHQERLREEAAAIGKRMENAPSLSMVATVPLPPTGRDGDGDKRKQWQEAVQRDPVIAEAIQVLRDELTLMPPPDRERSH